MPGNPQLICPVPAVLIQADMTALSVSQGGVATAFIDATQEFDVSATLEAGGLATFVAVPYTVTYFFESIGGGNEGSLGNKAGVLNDAAKTPKPGCAGAFQYSDALTKVTVAVNTLTPGGTWKLTTLADIGFGGASAFFEGPIIRT